MNVKLASPDGETQRPAALRLALIGTRGVPANYGGFETFAQELSTRLARRGHDVTVYGRRHHVPAGRTEFEGVRIRSLPSLRYKYLDTPVNTLLATTDSLFRGFDALLVCNAANAFACVLPRLAGLPVVLNVDGLEWQRKKWNWLGRGVYRLSESLAGWVASRLVSDARTIQGYYRRQRGVDTSYIPYGAAVERVSSRRVLEQLELESGCYLLYVSRLEPENNAHLVIEAYLQAAPTLPLVIVGDAPYSRAYIERLRRLADCGDVRLVGAHYGLAYRELLAHCHSYYQATEVGGTHPALVEAMGAGCRVVAHDTPESREVLADTGTVCDFYDRQALAGIMAELARDPTDFDPMAGRARERVRLHYDWETVADAYEQLLAGLVRRKAADRSGSRAAAPPVRGEDRT